MIIYRNSDIKTARAQIHADALSGGKMRLYTGTMPINGGAITTETLLIELPFATPAGVVSNGAFVLDAPIEGIAIADGVATWARILSSADDWVMDLDAGASGSGAAIVVNPQQIYAGGTIRINQFSLNEP